MQPWILDGCIPVWGVKILPDRVESIGNPQEGVSMDSDQERLKAQLLEKLSLRLDEVMASPTVTMTDIENVVAEFQRDLGREVAEGLLRLKKKTRKES